MRSSNLREEPHYAWVSDFIVTQRASVKTHSLSPALELNGFHNTSGMWLNLCIGEPVSVILEAGKLSPCALERHLERAGTQLDFIPIQVA